MGSIIVALPKIEDANKIANLLKRHGVEVDKICSEASEVLQQTHDRDNGVVIVGNRFKDMSSLEMYEYLPKFYDMIVISSAANYDYPPEVIRICAPFKTIDLVNTIEMLLSQQRRRIKKAKAVPKPRTEEENRIIDKAKKILMERNDMTEPEAYRYIQTSSMNSGTNFVETAEMIIMLNPDD